MPVDLSSARERLYGNESLTDELDDQPARRLLQWAEGLLARLAERHDSSDEEAFEDAFADLRKLMKSMNRFAARRGEMAPDEQADYVQKRIVSRAGAMGLAPEGDLAGWLQSQAALDQLACVESLIKLVEGGSHRADHRPPPMAL